ncbi:MAG TPA: DUF4360 domain-containing protein [Thiolinea sp.]|nr:DUF4360 domain-containing protein [Thiolinea sp.]
MTLLKTTLMTTVLALSMMASAQAAPVYFKAPISFAGTGCPAGSIPPPAGVGTDTLSILFGTYDTGQNAASGRPKTASCNFAIPMHVPQGYQVSLLTADWQGYAEGKTRLKRRYFFPMSSIGTTPWKTSNFSSPGGVDYLKKDKMIHSSLTWSPCGKDVTFRINSRIHADTWNSYMAVDTLDMKNRVIFHLQWQTC